MPLEQEVRFTLGRFVARPLLVCRAMRVAIATILGLVTIATLCACAAAPPSVLPTTIPTRDGLSCRAYTLASSRREPVRDVFLWMGGTGTGTSARVPETMRELLETLPVAFVTFDKPGIAASFGDPRSVTIDDDALARHTQGTLLECAERALDDSVARFGARVRWHLVGHSEGALLALFVYDELLASRPADAARVQSLVLSGLPLEPFAQMLKRQLADKPELARAVASCDWSVMRHLGVSCAYVRDAEARPSGRAMFERLAARAGAARFVVFAGARDAHTPAAPVRDLEAWSREHPELHLEFHYYDGDHRGTPEARRAMSEVLRRLARTP